MQKLYLVYDSAGERYRASGEGPPSPLPDGDMAIQVTSAVYTSPRDDLTALKSFLISTVNAGAAAARATYRSTTPGQEVDYDRKFAAATAYLAASSPEVADYPDIADESDATGLSLTAAASSIVAARTAQEAKDRKIEKARRIAEEAVKAASAIAPMVTGSTVDWTAVLTA